jgi:hypothetical protein
MRTTRWLAVYDLHIEDQVAGRWVLLRLSTFRKVITGMSELANIAIVEGSDKDLARDAAVKIFNTTDRDAVKVFQLDELENGWSYYF